MDHLSFEKARRQYQYIDTMRPVFSRRGLYSDTTEYYVSPCEPACFEEVEIKIRTRKDNVDYIFLVTGDQEIPMKKSYTEGYFDYYTTKVKLTTEEFSYYFAVHAGKIRCFFDIRGAVKDHDDHFNFRIIPGFHTPDWAKGAVMYQIFTDRFRNGDESNDVVTGEYTYINELVEKEEDWYADPSPHMDVRRFYGGDLQGIIDKLDYIQDLGIEVIYLNPIFVSPSNHKYDIQDYDNIDPHYGKIVKDLNPTDETPIPDQEAVSDEEGGYAYAHAGNRNAKRYIERVTSKENLDAGNALFAELVKKAHDRGIRVILDGVFNHCGSFNKWMDKERIYEHARGYDHGAYTDEDSPYKEFFSFRPGSRWPYNNAYDGWWGHDTLPKLNYEGSDKLWDYMMKIARKWISEPYNADGWRLDVAADLGHSDECNHRFWKDFRKAVKNTKKDALILAEHYGNAASWLAGDEWDSVMNYDAFMEPVSWFFTGMEKHSDEFRPDLIGYVDGFWGAMYEHGANMTMPSYFTSMNELSNHDHSRFLTRTNHMAGRADRLGSHAASEGVDKAVMRLAVMVQMTWPGAPTVYYGDEAGLCGFTDPDNRRTYPWGREDVEMLNFHKAIIAIHRANRELKTGSLIRLKSDYNTLAYSRFNDKEQTLVIINNNDQERVFVLSAWEGGCPRDSELTCMLRSEKKGYVTRGGVYKMQGGVLEVTVPGKGGLLLKAGGDK